MDKIFKLQRLALRSTALAVGSLVMLLFPAMLCPAGTAQSSDSVVPAAIGGLGKGLDAGAYYAPPLPSPKFIDSEQEQLAKSTNLKSGDLVYFADGKDSAKPELCAIRYDLKPWSEREKKDVQIIVDRILHVAPGLLIRAASGGKLALCRTASISASHTSPASVNSAHSPAGVTCACAIVLSDRFFESRLQFHGLVHELVHECDLTGRICYSKEWVRYINPTISKSRLEMALSPTYKSRSLAEQLRRKNLCPSAYSCENLQEALAEMTAAYVDDSGFQAEPTFFKQFGRRLLLPSDADQFYDMQFKRASIEFCNNNYAESVNAMLPVVAAEPDLAVAHARLAASYAKVDENLALDEAKKAIECYTASGAPWTEPEVKFARGWLTSCCYNKGDFSEALQFLNQSIAKVPFDDHALYERFYVERQQKNYGDAMRDLYWSRFGSDYAELLQDADADVDFVSKALDSDVEKFPQLSLVVLRRAHFLEWLGDRQADDTKRKSFYRRALSDYQRAAHLDCSSITEVPLDCCNINLKLNDESEAEKYESAALKEQPESMETKIMHIEILCALGKQIDAAKEYAQIWTKFGKELIPHPTS